MRNKRIFFIISLLFFLLVSFKINKVYASYWELEIKPVSECESELGSFNRLCCHTQSGCSSDCGFIPWYSYCYETDCKALVFYDTAICGSSYWYQFPSYDEYGDIIADGICREDLWYEYSTEVCPATDSCEGGPKLKCGLCLESGCGKCSGYYKQCCDNMTVHSPST